MNSFKYRLPAELKNRLHQLIFRPTLCARPQMASCIMAELNMGPASWLASSILNGKLGADFMHRPQGILTCRLMLHC